MGEFFLDTIRLDTFFTCISFFKDYVTFTFISIRVT